MICKSYSQAVGIAKNNANRSGQPWRVWQDNYGNWHAEKHEAGDRPAYRYEIYHQAAQLELPLVYPRRGIPEF